MNLGFCFFFFFKQKTAYEMRISDWSSDVCSSDLIVVKPVAPILRHIEMFSGNTILGDGSVIMILDPNGIASATGEISMAGDHVADTVEIGRASCRERVCQYV